MASHHQFAQLADQDLVTLAAAGDSAAFGALTVRHSGLVRGLLRRMGAQPAVADDVAQDAFIAAYTGLGGYRGEGAFSSWVCRIAARLYVKQVRREYRYDLMAETPDDEAEHPDPGLSMDLDEALKSLSAAERLCVSLCSGAGMSHPEAAEALKIPLGTVKSHVKRGLDKLRVRLAAHADEHGVRSRPHG